MMSEWICHMTTKARVFAPTAACNRFRFSRTFSFASQPMKLRLRSFCPSSVLAPPNLVLKPCTNQWSFVKGISSSTCKLPDLRSLHGSGIESEKEEARAVGRVRLLCSDVFLTGTVQPV